MRIHRTIAAALALIAALAPPPVTGGTIRHYAPDSAYDKPILIRCAGGAVGPCAGSMPPRWLPCGRSA